MVAQEGNSVLASVNVPGYAVAAVASVVVIVSSVAPWANAAFISVPGTHADGKFTLALGCVAALVLLIKASMTSRWPLVVAALAGALSLVVAVVDLTRVSSLVASDDLQGGAVSIGWGLWMVAVGSVLLIVGCVVSGTGASRSVVRATNPASPTIGTVDPRNLEDRVADAALITAIAFGGVVAILVWLDLLFGLSPL
ncbi:hypothetical protein R1CP_40390 (plasmid) [Rhodococcus opacus]|uniref:Uncharacterized protein n=1 Tax=Rhodococcus opacus TaxID=37919 RepID=A0A1B1KJ72_RHOOP|nr:hypothetical protein [Rhodococcus opacus]ANS32658.1 hypothetical protein R1CP_40390 [Rhodococcus opacus]